MTIRLLQKRDIDALKAKARQQEVAEGLKLARQIDRLREVMAQEEESLRIFRITTIKSIHAEIEKESKECEEIKRDIALLKKEREELLKPLDDEWERIKQKATELEERGKRIVEEEARIERLKKATDELHRTAANTRSRLATLEDVLSAKAQDIELLEKETQKAVDSARKLHSDAQSYHAEMVKELTHRDMVMASRERGIIMRQEALDEREEEIEKEWKVLEDRKKSIDRIIKRTKK